MQLAEIGSFKEETQWSNDDPFVSTCLPGAHTTAAYWSGTFGAADETTNTKVFIAGFKRGAFVKYAEASSINDCRSTEKTFYWDDDNQVLYVHFEHDQSFDSDVYYYETFYGYTDQSVIYIDDQEFLPLLESSPGVSQQQDLINYSKLSFSAGSLVLNNVGGIIDFFIDQNVYGNTVFISYIDPDDIIEIAPNVFSASRSDIQRMQAFYIEDYQIGTTQIVFKLQDIRKSNDITIPNTRFNSTDYPYISEDHLDKIIPIAYGPIREMKAIPTDEESGSSTDVTFRVAVEMVDFGTIQVDIDGVWTTVLLIFSSLSTGTFQLDASDARDSSGAVRACRLVDCEGIANTSAGDVIVDLNDKYLNRGFNSTFYDTTEWTSESSSLVEIGVVFDEEIKLYNAIEKIQNGSNIGFRYEVNADGKYTLRIDDEERDLTGILYNRQFDRFKFDVDSDTDLVYSEINVQYSKSYNSGRYLLEKNDDFKDEVAQNNQQRSLFSETLLTTESQAEARALNDATKFKNVPRIVKLTIDTPTKSDRETFLKLRIFDILKAELSTADFIDLDDETFDGREMFGIQAIKIISINPSFDRLSNNIRAKLLPNYIERVHFDFTRTTGQSHFDFTRTGSTQKHYDFTRE